MEPPLEPKSWNPHKTTPPVARALAEVSEQHRGRMLATEQLNEFAPRYSRERVSPGLGLNAGKQNPRTSLELKRHLFLLTSVFSLDTHAACYPKEHHCIQNHSKGPGQTHYCKQALMHIHKYEYCSGCSVQPFPLSQRCLFSRLVLCSKRTLLKLWPKMADECPQHYSLQRVREGVLANL